METDIVYWELTGIMEKQMETMFRVEGSGFRA